MPTKIRRKPVEGKAPECTQADLDFLVSGRWDLTTTGGFITFCTTAHPRNRELAGALWGQVGPNVVKAWIRLYPGRRPWAWWRWDAPEPRRVIGTEPETDPLAPWHDWREAFGVPIYPETAGGVRIESEPTYLQRLELLTPREVKVLTPADFEPTTLNGESNVDAEGPVSAGAVDESTGAASADTGAAVS